MAKLGVNIDHVATLRQARGGKNPDPVWAARVCQKAGASSIVMHLREDRRHIQDADLFAVQKAINIKLNMEMAIAPSVVSVALKLKPHQVTLVPEKRKERTTESGLDLFHKTPELRRVIGEFKKRKISVSLFLDPDSKQVELAKALGVDAIEFHTGDYANFQGVRRGKELERIKRAAKQAQDLGMITHAGHGLDYTNAKPIAEIKGMDELNIGYSIISESLKIGLEESVRKMKALIR